MKKLLKYALIAFVVFYLITNPTGAADAVNDGADALAEVGESLSRFVNRLH